MSGLLVLVPDVLSAILDKGEFQPRYYNPGGLFDTVHLLTTARDAPDLAALQRTVGTATLTFDSFPEPEGMAHRPWRDDEYRLLRQWAAPIVARAKALAPDLIRCHGADWNTYAAALIKEECGIPYVVSLHTNADVHPYRRFLSSHLTPDQWRENELHEYLERTSLAAADLVIPVYRPILPYLERMGVRHYKICYNVLNSIYLSKKTNYALHNPVRCISVGRIYKDKKPSNLLRAVAELPDINCTIVGDGPLRPALIELAATLGIAARTTFLAAVPNDDLCRMLPEFDVFAIHSQCWECNKSLLEALLTGLPCVLNRRRGLPVPELEGDFILKVEDTAEGYRQALESLLTDHARREALGRAAFAHARARWDPAKTEAVYVSIYRDLLVKSGRA